MIGGVSGQVVLVIAAGVVSTLTTTRSEALAKTPPD